MELRLQSYEIYIKEWSSSFGFVEFKVNKEVIGVLAKAIGIAERKPYVICCEYSFNVELFNKSAFYVNIQIF